MELGNPLPYSTVLDIAQLNGPQDPLMKMSNNAAANILREYSRIQQQPRARQLPQYGTSPIRIVSFQRYSALSKRRWFRPGLVVLVVDADAADDTAYDDEEPIDAYFEGLPDGVYAKWSTWKPRKETPNLYCKNLSWRVDDLDGLDGLWKSRLDRNSESHVAYVSGLKRSSTEMYALNWGCFVAADTPGGSAISSSCISSTSRILMIPSILPTSLISF